MKRIPREDIIVRDSMLLPFRGSELWGIELDSLSTHTEVAIEKFERDIKYACRSSTTSKIAIHVKDTQLNHAFVTAIVGGLNSSDGNIRKVAFIGVEWLYKIKLSKLLRKSTTGIEFCFFRDYEKAKEWLIP